MYALVLMLIHLEGISSTREQLELGAGLSTTASCPKGSRLPARLGRHCQAQPIPAESG